MPNPKIYILVINWNNYDDTRECLVSLKGVLYQDYTVVVIDNSSSDSSDEKIRKEFPEFIHIRNHENGLQKVITLV